MLISIPLGAETSQCHLQTLKLIIDFFKIIKGASAQFPLVPEIMEEKLMRSQIGNLAATELLK